MLGHTARARVNQPGTADQSPQDSPRTPGLIVVAAAVLSFAVCITNFALGEAGAGLAAGIVALLAFGAGLSWLSMDRRRLREAERDAFADHTAR